jgi:hypothetical protein
MLGADNRRGRRMIVGMQRLKARRHTLRTHRNGQRGMGIDKHGRHVAGRQQSLQKYGKQQPAPP